MGKLLILFSYGIENATNVDRFLIERYQTYVYRRVHPQHQQQLSAHFRSALLIAVSRFFHWLTCENLLLYNPASEMQFPKVANRLPRTILNAQQAKQIMQQPNTSTPLGVRDRAILETLYSTAARRKELANLAIDDVSLDNATVFIKQGKGYKDRYLPLTPSSIHWLDIYLTHVRPALLKDREQKALFLHKLGGSFGLDNLGKLVRGYVKAANVGKTGSFLLFRHTVATLMLERGADLRYIQELLGHQNLETTQIYTRVSIGKLKEVHERTHPAKMKPTKTQQIIEELEDSD